MTIKELFEYMKEGTEEQNEEALAVVDDIMNAIKTKFPSYYKKYESKLEDIYSRSALTEKEAKEYVSHMKNKDGSVGEHWTLSQVQSFMGDHPEYLHIKPICFYVAMNMMYSDYYTPTTSVETYARLAKDFLDDRDAKPDKLKKYLEVMFDK